jgi:hypothetical protein
MRAPVFRQRLAWVVTAISITVLAVAPDATVARQNFHSQAPAQLHSACARMNVRCPRKKAIASKRKATKHTKDAEAKPTAKPTGKRRAAKSTISQKPKRPKAVATAPLNKSRVEKSKVSMTPRPKVIHPASPNFLPEIVLHVPKPPPPKPQPSLGPGLSDCRNALSRRNADFSIPSEVEGTGICHVSDPVQLTSVMTKMGRVELPGAPLLNCVFAQQFVIWLSDIAAPVVAELGKSKLSSISTGTSYQCRRRNGDNSGKMSEHAFGNAIDIAGITLANKKRIEITAVSDLLDPNYRLLMALRTAACGYFTTVLGPGADAAHASHFHFDLGIHGKSSNYRICK